ncbi:MAG TPA: tetratricopeptide repeat protein [Polyangia bacterium]|jgi:tetratricopeptide (TPR) repeat protein|nr:tetratricopeptide repeat protein [Polyangia bacterium]
MRQREASYLDRRSRFAIGAKWGLAAAFALGVLGNLGSFGFSARLAHADEIDDTVKKLIDLDQRVHLMSLEFKEAPPPAPDAADRRVLDAQVQLSVKNYDEAATIALDVVEKYPNTRAYDDALYLLGESLFQGRDYYSARHYLQEAVAKNNGSKAEQQALQRLVEVALRTGDYENVDVYLKRLENVPAASMEPSVPYVRAKYLYFRGRLDEATAVFASIPTTNPYYFQARYFLATIQVKRGDLAGASTAYDDLLKQQPPDDTGKDIQDLARLAIARIFYERSQFDKAIEVYLAVPRQSLYWSEALREQAWTYIKAKDWQRAYRSVNLLLLYDPDTADAPDLRLLEGNLELRMNNFYLASDEFSKVRDEFEPIHRQLQQVIVKSQTDPAYFDSLVGKSLDKFDIGVFVPPTAAKWVKAEPDVARMMSLASDVGEMQRDLVDSQKLVERIEHVMQGSGRVGIFPDLAAARTKSVESMNQIVGTRERFVQKIRAIIDPVLTPEERKQLDQLAILRDGYSRQASNLPTTDEGLQAHERTMKDRFGDLDKQVSEMNVEIQSLEAQLVALEQYYRVSRSEQKIRPEDIEAPVRDMRAAIEDLRAMHDQLREQIADATRDAGAAGSTGEAEREAAEKLSGVLAQELTLERQAAMRLGGPDRGQVDRVNDVLSRCDAIQTQLDEFDKRVDGQATVRLATVTRYLTAEKEELAAASDKLGGILDESKSLGGGLAQAMFTKVADKFYDLVVRSDVGIIDVSWGLKDQKTQSVTKLTNLKNLELKALDEDFRRVLEDDK